MLRWILILLWFPVGLLAEECDDTIRVSGATQSFYSGSSVASFQLDSAVAHSSVRDLQILLPGSNLSWLEGFVGSCGFQKAPRFFVTRRPSTGVFVENQDSTLFVNWYDSSTAQLTGTRYAAWFGWFEGDSLGSVSQPVGKYEGGLYTRWYGWARYQIEARESQTGSWVDSIYGLTFNHHDSTTVFRALTQTWEARDTLSRHRNRQFQLHMIRVTYASQSTSPISPLAHPENPVFRVKQDLRNIWIETNMVQGTDRTLTVHDMMGMEVARLLPQGDRYQWNGVLPSGRPARRGVYFIRNQNQILGKLFYRGSS